MSFSRYSQEDSVISSETVVRGMWTGDVYKLPSVVPSSTYTEYYLDIYGSAITTTTPVEFSIQYGHRLGSGSAIINTQVPNGGYTPSRVVYGEYRNLVYGTENQNFTFDEGINTIDQIYAININREKYKQSILPGSLNLTLTNAGKTIKLIDDSNTTSLTRFAGQNRVYYLVSGSNGVAFNSVTRYGMLLPDLGVIILEATGSLKDFIAAPTLATSSAQNNHLKLKDAISAGSNFQLQSSEVVSSRYFFTRVKNSEYNYTTNPSIIDDNGNIIYNTLINSPQTFITAVGMYNDNNELLAVAKLSKPLPKDFTKEALVRIKLDY